MSLIQRSKTVTIFEGPDGGGKSTAAMAFADAAGARYVHLGPFPRVTSGLARLYAEAMMPAVLGYQDVVLDRCWFSEAPYGFAFRGGTRLGAVDCRMLERLALRCGAVVIWCLPPWDKVAATFEKRKGREMLKSETQLRMVFEDYVALAEGTGPLPAWRHDYTKDRPILERTVHGLRLPRHPLELASAGNWAARTILVGQDFAEHKDADPLYQWPFASFTDSGCSRWWTASLDAALVHERDLLWVNADQVGTLQLYEKEIAKLYAARRVIALGAEADEILKAADIHHHVYPHPQYWKRFHSKEPYPIKEMMK